MLGAVCRYSCAGHSDWCCRHVVPSRIARRHAYYPLADRLSTERWVELRGGELSWSRLKAGITSSSVQHPSDLHSATPLGGGTPQHSKHLDSECGQPDVYAITTCTTRSIRACAAVFLRKYGRTVRHKRGLSVAEAGCRSGLHKRVAELGVTDGGSLFGGRGAAHVSTSVGCKK